MIKLWKREGGREREGERGRERGREGDRQTDRQTEKSTTFTYSSYHHNYQLGGTLTLYLCFRSIGLGIPVLPVVNVIRACSAATQASGSTSDVLTACLSLPLSGASWSGDTR